KTKGPLYKFREKNGEEPVLASMADMETNRSKLENILQNKGFFYPQIQGELATKRKKTKAKFDVKTGRQYFINETFFEHDTTSTLGEDIYALRDETLLEPGQPYNLDLIKGERERIDRELKEIGFYYFKADYILVKADTTIGDNKVNLYVTIKKDSETPDNMYNIYNIQDVYIFPNFRLRGSAAD